MEQFSPKTKSKDLAGTWSILDREPGMDNLAENAAEILQQMGEDLNIYPFQDRDQKDRLFLARFEFVKFGGAPQFPEVLQGEAVAFIDFLAGFPIDCVEMLIFVGEISSKPSSDGISKVSVQPGTGAVPPVPQGESALFKWPEKEKILLNLTALATKDVGKIFAPNLKGEPKPTQVKWWFRVQLAGGAVKFPVPGEFGALGVRLFPGVYWGHQKSSPFVYSGNWMDSVFYTAALIKEVIDPTDDLPYATYKVIWHGKTEITVWASDFSEYKVGDRVCIMKDIVADKITQLWKDDDMKADCDKTAWQIVPITFYGLEKPEGG
jgi:hypothetical protein